MNQLFSPRIAASACPHDCPSTCALEVEVFDGQTIGRVRGAKDNAYTAGMICAKVARYAERVHHPDRLKHPLRRTGAKGTEFAPISWDDALDLVAGQFVRAEERHGSEAVWPYYYAGTMGYVMRDGIHRLRHAKKYSGFFSTICVNPAWTGFIAGTGKLAGADPREMAKSDLVVIWGTNAVNTQVNVMTHATRARKKRGAKIVAVDIYMNSTMQQADLPVLIRPGTDGALACAVMHCLFRDGKADWDYLNRYTDGQRKSPVVRSRQSKRLPGLSASASALISASATGSRARATAPSTCMPLAAFRWLAAPGSWRAAARSTTMAIFSNSTRA
jgi:anaerobic selenocysteine-containing dehydrogenase